MFFALDSLKFYKLKSEGIAQALFVILYVLFLGFAAFPIGEIPDIQVLMQTVQSGDFSKFQGVTTGNIVYLISNIFFMLITSYFSIIYATCFVMEKEGFPGRKGIIDSIKKIPLFLGLILLLLVPAAMSSFFLFIPLFFMFYSLYMAPLFITEGKVGIIDSIVESYKWTKGYKLAIFFSHMVLVFILNIPTTIFRNIFLFNGYSGTLPEHLVLAFVGAFRVLVMGRLMGNLYYIIVKTRKDVLSGEKLTKGGIFDFPKNNDEEENDDEEDSDNIE